MSEEFFIRIGDNFPLKTHIPCTAEMCTDISAQSVVYIANGSLQLVAIFIFYLNFNRYLHLIKQMKKNLKTIYKWIMSIGCRRVHCLHIQGLYQCTIRQYNVTYYYVVYAELLSKNKSRTAYVFSSISLTLAVTFFLISHEHELFERTNCPTDFVRCFKNVLLKFISTCLGFTTQIHWYLNAIYCSMLQFASIWTLSSFFNRNCSAFNQLPIPNNV